MIYGHVKNSTLSKMQKKGEYSDYSELEKGLDLPI
jgi:hypothetical protein